MGLYIVQELVTAQGGQVWLDEAAAQAIASVSPCLTQQRKLATSEGQYIQSSIITWPRPGSGSGYRKPNPSSVSTMMRATTTLRYHL